jgi:hypothetical protein
MEKETSKKTKKRLISLKTKFIIFQTLIIIGLVAGGYLYYTMNKEKTGNLDQLLKLQQKMDQEKERCGVILSQNEGNFDDRTYCRILFQKFSEGK